MTTQPEITMWRYAFPSINGEGWAVILMDSSGVFSAVSDYGDYAHYWNHHGCKDFREFFLGSSRDYMLRKLHPKKEYDSETTLDVVLSTIIEERRAGTLTKEEARDTWHEVRVHHNDLESEFNFFSWVESGPAITESWELYRDRFPVDAQAFVDNVMPRLAAVLKAELHTEGKGEFK